MRCFFVRVKYFFSKILFNDLYYKMPVFGYDSPTIGHTIRKLTKNARRNYTKNKDHCPTINRIYDEVLEILSKTGDSVFT